MISSCSPGSSSGPPTSLGRGASIGHRRRIDRHPAGPAVDLGLLAGGQGLAGQEAGLTGRLGVDPGHIDVETEALDRQGQPGGGLLGPGSFDRCLPGCLVDPVDLGQPIRRGGLDGIPAGGCRVGPPEGDPGRLLGRPDLARVGQDRRLGGTQGELVVRPLLFAQGVVGGGGLLAQALGQVAAFGSDPALVGARSGQRPGVRSRARRLAARPAAGGGRHARLGGLGRWPGLGRGPRPLGNGDGGWPGAGHRSSRAARRAGRTGLPERVEDGIRFAGDREGDQVPAADRGPNVRSTIARHRLGQAPARQAGPEGQWITRAAPAGRCGDRALVVDGQGCRPALGQRVGGDRHPDLTRGTGPNAKERDEQRAGGRAD